MDMSTPIDLAEGHSKNSDQHLLSIQDSTSEAEEELRIKETHPSEGILLSSHENIMGIATRADYLACREIMRRASRNYSFASAFLPKDKLPHVEALYGFLRIGDDRVDVSHHGFSNPLDAIDAWERTYYDAFLHGGSPHPVMRAYLDTAIRFSIPIETMSPYFREMRSDLTVTRFPTFDHLMTYMEGSAIPVGRAMTHILGVRPPFTFEQALPGADSLSIAMQLSNFWRDIGSDWCIGRVYIPQEDLHRFSYTEDDLASKTVSLAFTALLEYEFERTELFYSNARSAVRMLASGRWAVRSGLEVYRAIIPEIRSNGYDVFNRRAGASLLRKLGLGLRARFLVD